MLLTKGRKTHLYSLLSAVARRTESGFGASPESSVIPVHISAFNNRENAMFVQRFRLDGAGTNIGAALQGPPRPSKAVSSATLYN